MTEPTKRPREPKSERIELRVSSAARSVIEQAVAVSGLTAGEVAVRGARLIVEEHERMVLRGADREAFLQAVRNPPKPTARLKAAFQEHARKIATE